MAINGSANSEAIPGTAAADEINFSQGGNDTVSGLGGDDTIFGGAAFNAFDEVNGGSGYDILDVNGNYAGGVTFGANTLRHIDQLTVHDGFNYSFTTHDATVAAGQMFKVDGYFLTAGRTFHFDGSAETNGWFLMYDGASNDTFIGGQQSDIFSMSYDGADTVYGNAGEDGFNMGGAFDNNDHLDGGTGNDYIHLVDDYSTMLVLEADTIVSIETITFNNDFVYKLKTHDGNIAAGEAIFFDGRGLSGAGYFVLDASDETDGSIAVIDGINNDTIYGSQNGDDIRGGAGSNQYFGLGGDDQFLLDDFDATDQVFGGAGDDWLALHNDYSAGLFFQANSVVDVETIQIYDNGTDYRLTLHDGNVGGGQTMRISSGTTAANSTFIDGSAETDGILHLGSGAGNDTLIGGAGGDDISDQNGGDDTFEGRGGDDSFRMFGTFTETDSIDGGTGADSVYIQHDTDQTMTLGAAQLANMESITFGGDANFTITSRNSLVAQGQTLAVDAYYLAAEHSFVFDGSAEIDGRFVLTGGIGDDSLTGGSKNDTLTGGQGGTDTLVGGLGKDVYRDSLGDVIVEAADGGRDTVESEVNYSLAPHANVEDLQLTGFDTITGIGNSLDNRITGNSVANDLRGGAGDDTLDGSFGADTLRGSDGDDVYYNPEAIDTVIEQAGGGRDRVESYYTVSIAAWANVEDIVLLGPGAADATGNDGNNLITGTSSFNRLWGGAGNDTLNGFQGADAMRGGEGNDTYYVNEANDKTIETDATHGIDTVMSAVSRTLNVHLENLILLGGQTGNGNGLDNQITGNDSRNLLQGFDGADTLEGGGGRDTLKGGAGADSMVGGDGKDRYFVDNAGDRTVETDAAGGRDVVYTTITLTLGDNLEVLRMQGAGNLNGFGNALRNKLVGNEGDNRLQGHGDNDVLWGMAGNDTLVGGAGNDTMMGGAGMDLIRVTMTSAGADKVLDFNKNADRFDLSGGTFSEAQLVGSDTILHHDGGTIRIMGVNNLTLAQWNALVIPSVASLESADQAESPADLSGLSAVAPQLFEPAAHADFLWG